jgi:hypothetical protein
MGIQVIMINYFRASKLNSDEIFLYESLINDNPEELNSAIIVHY